MDVPNTGAVFTLGKSYLAENTQSYFYIKNDPIKRLIAGPNQSAVICESGRLFVWGENRHGQLGIGSQYSSNTNNINKNNNSNEDIIIKPTCVKSLKTLGLKIADISFGNDWSIILTLSNELFFTGRNIFASDCTVSRNFAKTTVNDELCEIIQRPFRLEEFDDCLSNNEEAENFINVLAGNEHFVLLTSFGRLIGWGSNESHQLGRSKEDVILRPHEIILDSAVQLYTCGPESTLVLTGNEKLYLTGRLNEFVFPNFTELQKNLSSNEQIIFMNISKASEIFIVTNRGSVYRSYESVRNKSLIFQRFYDYDSEENGPIWKLLKGTSFYAVLSKANKFYTTFSQSGHHLKTFREISKFKSLRILDMALGDDHILVHGIPRSSTLAATIGPVNGHRHVTQSMIMANTTAGILNRESSGRSIELDETKADTEDIKIKEEEEEEDEQVKQKTNTLIQSMKDENEPLGREETDTEFLVHLNNNNISVQEVESETVDLNHNDSNKESEESIESFETGNTVVSKKSPTQSLKSETISINSQKKIKQSETSSVKSLRPRTPFPEINPHGSPQLSMKKTPLRNLSYEAAISNAVIKNTSQALAESLENIHELVTKESDLTVSMSTPPTEDDEELRLEISETTDPLDHTVTVNEIRFINNGIDVTANVEKLKSDSSQDSLDVTDEEDEENEEAAGSHSKLEIRKQAENFIDELEDEIDKKVKIVRTSAEEENKLFKVRSKGNGDTVESAAVTTATSVIETVGDISDSTKNAAKEAKQSLENMGNSVATENNEARQALSQMGYNVAKATGEAKDSMNSALKKIAGDTKHAVGTVTSKIATEVQEAKNSLNSMLQYKKNKVDIQKNIDQEDYLLSEGTSKESGGGKSNSTTQSNNTGVQEDDERTTASANSNHTASAANPFESTDPFDPELDAMVQRGKQALREELQAASVAAENKTDRIIDVAVEDKSKFSKFLDELREKSKSLSCRSEKSTKIVDDQPPRYSVEDELSGQPVNSQNTGSKVCSIL